MTNTQLVPVIPGTIGNIPQLTVCARALHTALRVKRDFTTWIKGRINKYCFVENEDYEVFTNSGENPAGGRPAMEYRLSLNMGKELSMIENNDMGRLARRYFIECERRALENLSSPTCSEFISPDQQCTLQAMVRALVEKGGIYAAIWSRFNNHFRLGSYKQLPQSRMSEAVDYLMRFEVASKALPAPSVAAVPNPPASIPADMAPGRKDALRKIQSIMNAIMAAREVVNMFCYPEPATMDRPKEVRLTYNARHDFHAAALDCLKAAYAALEAGYLLERGKSRMQGGGR